MSPRVRATVAMGLFLALLTGFAATVGWLLYLDVGPGQQPLLVGLVAPRLELLGGLAVLGLALFGGLFGLAWSAYAGGILRVVESLQVMLDANRDLRLPQSGPPEIRALAQAVNRLAERHAELARDMEARILRARVSVEEEKNRLAALMSELSLGVLVCNSDGRILLYNERARQALAAADGNGAPIGLGRSVFSVIDRNLVTHALDALRVRMDKDSGDLIVHLVATTHGGQLLRLQIAPVLTTETHAEAVHGSDRLSRYALMSITGFVMTLDNITRSFEREAGRDRLLELLTEGTRAQLGSIRAAVESLLAYPDCEAEQRERFVRVIGEEAKSLSDSLDRVMSEHAGALKNRWPLEDMYGSDLVAAARRRIEARLGMRTEAELIDEQVWLRCDSYTLIRALGYLAGRLKDEYDVREIRFGLSAQGRLALLDLSWEGAPVSSQTLYLWETEPLTGGGEDSPLTLRDITERHGAEIAYLVHKARFRAMFRLLLPLASPTEAAPSAAPIRYGESRPEFYDFDLFHRSGQSREWDGRPLTELAYTVLDTETTGLDPSGGDEIISMGAVRIVNNRLLRGETLIQLVDPGRASGATAASIHGITAEMLIGQPTIDQVLPRLHAFCEDTVLVGHNIAFDMRFLQLKEAQSGVRFTQPVLDTLLLSAVLHPQQHSHALEEIAARLGVPVTDRHTALGDALVTGEVFLRMIPLLAAQGIVTLRQAREAAEKSMYARVEY